MGRNETLLTARQILKVIDDCLKKQKEEESDLHNLGMLDGMLVIQAAVNGRPWPL